jgi:hypothetical protein
MQKIPVSVEPEGEEYSTQCSCCGRPVHWGHGWLMSESRPLAAFWYQWPEGHEGRFNLAIARFSDEEFLVPGVVCVAARVEGDALVYSILERDECSWSDFGKFGEIATREQGLLDRQNVFRLVDAIAANERRISSRILGSGLHGRHNSRPVWDGKVPFIR